MRLVLVAEAAADLLEDGGGDDGDLARQLALDVAEARVPDNARDGIEGHVGHELGEHERDEPCAGAGDAVNGCRRRRKRMQTAP